MLGIFLAAMLFGAGPCEDDPNFHAFDFWIGDWAVYSNSTDKFVGHNKITSIESGCALEEKWRSQSGNTGTSLNFYTPQTGKWRQIWVADGYNLDISGSVNEAGSMVMEGEIFDFKTGQSAPFRGTWTPQDGGAVRQHFQQFDADTQEWKDWFDGTYMPMKK